jgi:hypothetical protein
MKFVLRRVPGMAVSAEDVARVRALNVTVHEVSPKMIWVEGNQAVLTRFVDSEAGWRLLPEVTYSLPDSPRQRMRIEAPPSRSEAPETTTTKRSS